MGNFAENINLGNRFRPPWKIVAILNSALNTTRKPFLFQKVSKILFGDRKALIRCQDHHN